MTMNENSCWYFSITVHPCKWHRTHWNLSVTDLLWNFLAILHVFPQSLPSTSVSHTLIFDGVMQGKGCPNPRWHPAPLPCTYLSCNYPLICVASLLTCGCHTRLWVPQQIMMPAQSPFYTRYLAQYHSLCRNSTNTCWINERSSRAKS